MILFGIVIKCNTGIIMFYNRPRIKPPGVATFLSPLDLSPNFIPPFLTYGFAFLLSIWVVAVVQEIEKGHFQQLISQGCTQLTYYASLYLTDGMMGLLIAFLASIILYASNIKIFVTTSYLGWLLPICCFLWSLLGLSYLVSLIFPKGTKSATIGKENSSMAY